MRKWKLTGMLLAATLAWGVTNGSAAGLCGGDPPLPPDGLMWPLAGEVTTAWSLDCASDRGHRGIDIGAPAGSAVAATAGGMVAFVGYTPAEGGGLTIAIEHPGGLRSTYLRLREALVSEGQKLPQGATIGYSGDTPLHFGLKTTGGRETYFNPLELLEAPPAGRSRESAAPNPSPAAVASPAEPAPAVAAPEATVASAGTSPLPAPAPGVATAPEIPTRTVSRSGLTSISILFSPGGILEPAGALAMPAGENIAPSLTPGAFRRPHMTPLTGLKPGGKTGSTISSGFISAGAKNHAGPLTTAAVCFMLMAALMGARTHRLRRASALPTAPG